MSLGPGTRVGQYEIVSLIGAGGMGEVYRARDTKLNRDVALKILPQAFAADADRLARFKREAQVLASLNHPHIATIYGFEDSGATQALVLEFVDGPTLADRIRCDPISIDEALSVAEQIAEALEAAHEQAIVHRDLKPANIKLRGDGTVKVLDFGLAKALEPAVMAGPELSASPTITTPAMTGIGTILGTAAYMAPEQAKGRPADKRSDVWAFGCVLFEMLTGARAFGGDTVAEVLANTINADPDWRTLPRDTPSTVRTCLRGCLAKDPSRRFHDIADVRLVLTGAFAPATSDAESAGRARPVSSRVMYTGWIVAAAVTAGAAVVLLSSAQPRRVEPAETRLEILTPPADDPIGLAVSSDGRAVVFQGRGPQGRAQLWLRRLDAEEARPVEGTEGGSMPFWSPDSQSIGFFADAMMKRIDLASGFVRTLARAPQARRGTWNRDGRIVFGPASVGPLFTVPADGGAVTQATQLAPGHINHRWPQFLPDGRRFLVMVLGTPEVRGIYLGSLGDAQLRRVSDRESAYWFAPPDYVLFARQGALWARKLNREQTQVENELIPVAPRVLVNRAVTGYAAFSSSSSGVVAYRSSAPQTQLVWVDRAGRTLTALGPPDDTQPYLAHLSPDGRTASMQRVVNGNTDVWLVDTERGVPRRLTFDAAIDGEPIFSPDGRRLVYMTDGRADLWDTLYERAVDGSGDVKPIYDFKSVENKNPRDWSPDGRYILYTNQSVDTDYDLWALPLFGDRKPMEVSRTPFVEAEGRFSPDGRFVAYTSTETGRSEIYVKRFPSSGSKTQVSMGGGNEPRWRRDGRELFYRAPDNRLMSISITSRGETLQVETPRGLFRLPTTPTFEPAPDGQRFLVAAVVSDASQITVILNWKALGSAH